jgi:CRISPR-associated protein Cas2
MKTLRLNKSRFNAYQTMWVYVLFDLPVFTKDHRKRYSEFRKSLLTYGFSMVQFSVYNRYCSSYEQVEVNKRRIKLAIPAEGMVSIIVITDKQFGAIAHFTAGKREKRGEIPDQLAFF